MMQEILQIATCQKIPRVENRSFQESKQKQRQLKKKKKEETESSDDDDVLCLVCLEPFSNSRSREKWDMCRSCQCWAHKDCTPGDDYYICHNCNSD